MVRARGLDAHLTLAGDGPDEGALRDKFEALGLLNRVKFLVCSLRGNWPKSSASTMH